MILTCVCGGMYATENGEGIACSPSALCRCGNSRQRPNTATVVMGHPITEERWKERIELISKLGQCVGALQGLRFQVLPAVRSRIDKLLEDIGDPSVLWRGSEHASGVSSKESSSVSDFSQASPASTLLRCPYCETAPIEMKWKGHYGCPTETCAAYAANLLPDEWNQRVENLTLTVEDWLRDHQHTASPASEVIEIDEHGKVHYPLTDEQILNWMERELNNPDNYEDFQPMLLVHGGFRKAALAAMRHDRPDANPAPIKPEASVSDFSQTSPASTVNNFYREDGCSGNGYLCKHCGQMWVHHIAPNSICPASPASEKDALKAAVILALELACELTNPDVCGDKIHDEQVNQLQKELDELSALPVEICGAHAELGFNDGKGCLQQKGHVGPHGDKPDSEEKISGEAEKALEIPGGTS